MHRIMGLTGMLRRLYWSGVAAALLFASPAIAAGVAVEVTPEMTGAGIVSSGVTLPPIPPLTGNRKSPVAVVGQAAAVPDRDRRPAQQPADRGHARQAHRVGVPVAQPEDLSRQRRRELLGRRQAARGERGRQLRRAHRRLRAARHHLDLRRARHARQQGRPAELPRRRAPAGRRQVPDRRHPQLPRADHRPQGQQASPRSGASPASASHNPPQQLAHPNGATPMDNGDILVSEITEAWISRITRDGKVLWSVRAPNVRYPSDAFPTVDGKQVIVADFSKPGRVVIFDPATGKPSWEYFARRRREDARPPVARARAARHRRHRWSSTTCTTASS